MANDSQIPGLSQSLPLIGAATIDAQHRQLLQLLGELREWMARGYAVAALFNAMDAAEAYARLHFEYEEGLLVRIRYPDLEAHRAEHRRFIAWLAALRQRMEAGEDVSADLLDSLTQWIVGHISSSDVAYARYLKQGGAEDVS